MLDNYASKHKVRGHLLVGPFSSHVCKKSNKYCCVGPVANTIRLAIKELRRTGIQPSRWKIPSSWWHVLPENSIVSAYTCAALYSLADTDSRRDWLNECNVFGVIPNFEIPEEWAQSAWEQPRSVSADARSIHLDSLRFKFRGECAFGNGGYEHGEGVTISAQIRYFSPDSHYFITSCGQPTTGRLAPPPPVWVRR